MKSHVKLIVAMLLAAVISSCDSPDPSPEGTRDATTVAENTTTPANADGKTIEDLTKRLQADKSRIDKSAAKTPEPEEVTSLKNTAAAFFNTLIGDDDGAFRGYLLTDADIDTFFGKDSMVLKSGRNSSNKVNRRELKKLLTGLIANHGDVEVNGVIEEGGRLTARVVDIPFRAGNLNGSVKISGAAQTSSGWRFLRFVIVKDR